MKTKDHSRQVRGKFESLKQHNLATLEEWQKERHYQSCLQLAACHTQEAALFTKNQNVTCIMKTLC